MSAIASTSPARRRTGKSNWRWVVVIACALGLAINYIDRSAISVSLPYMTKDFDLTAGEQGLILSAFSWSYALMQIPAGSLIDKFGERLMFGASVLLWSIATGITAMASSFGVLLGIRLGLGVGEAGAYPSAAKTVAQWFPQRERARATGVYDSGARIGSAVATPVIAAVIGLWGWRAVFIIAAVLGVIWSAGWFALYRRPEFLSVLTQSELEHIHSDRVFDESGKEAPAEPRMKLVELLKSRVVLGMMLGFFSVNFIVTFFLTWFPTFLVSERGFSLTELGVLGALPPICSIAGSYIAGFTGDALLKRGWSVTRTRKTCLITGMFLCASIAGAAVLPATWQMIGVMCISYGAASFTITTIWCLPADVVPQSTVGLLGGAQNFFSNIGSALSPIVVGALYESTGSFQVPLLVTGCMALVGVFAFGVLINRVERIDHVSLAV